MLIRKARTRFTYVTSVNTRYNLYSFTEKQGLSICTRFTYVTFKKTPSLNTKNS